MRFTVATYNIHKGFTQLNRRMVIHELRERLHGLSADILLLQEVVGVHRGHAARHVDWPVKPQHEFIADTVWHEVAYGKNAISRHGHHGNAVLSRFPIVAHENLDISAHAFESRGLLHCAIKLGPGEPALHCINVHLGLFERGRKWQIHALCERIRATVPDGMPRIPFRNAPIFCDMRESERGSSDRKPTRQTLPCCCANDATGPAAAPSATSASTVSRLFIRSPFGCRDRARAPGSIMGKPDHPQSGVSLHPSDPIESTAYVALT
jgi:hypothetical protein